VGYNTKKYPKNYYHKLLLLETKIFAAAVGHKATRAAEQQLNP